jgi:hypothetical protein
VSMRKRLERLEARGSRRTGQHVNRSRTWERYFHYLENARREIDGLEPLPELPYTKEDYDDDLNTLSITIPSYRDSRGWTSEASRAFLVEWGSEARKRIERNEA